jgi:hypothetical protein
MMGVPRAGVIGLLCLVLAGCALLPRPGPGPSGTPPATPTATAAPVALDRPSRPVRVVMSSLGIDLPVISIERRVPGSTRGYPACDVALFWTYFDLPGQPGTTWILAHAQEGMFLPILDAVRSDGPGSLLGKLVQLQLRDGRLLTYRIFRVKPHAATSDLRIATVKRGRDEQRLILQTSTGVGSAPKVQVAARLIEAATTDEPPPRPRPRACG